MNCKFLIFFNLLLSPCFAGYQEIGQKIWQNECNCKIDALIFWNPHEECLSLGIGHFIWYPEGVEQKFDQMFPEYQKFLREKNIPIPALLTTKFPLWKTRDDFKAREAETLPLKNWFAGTTDLQAEFMVNRLGLSLNKILTIAPHLDNLIKELKKSDAALFALIDYLNFKGDGLLLTERYQGKGWGLYQVLQGMEGISLEAFKASALLRLKERVAHAPPEKNEARWLAGWSRRIQNY